jgi:predicted RNA-binding Zn-ribbon protein involved in translation (DUF1610 family)
MMMTMQEALAEMANTIAACDVCEKPYRELRFNVERGTFRCPNCGKTWGWNQERERFEVQA